jgi:hypothetical protein
LVALAATVIDLSRANTGFNIPGETLAQYWTASLEEERRQPEPLLSEVQQAWDLPAWYPTMQGPLKSLVL